MGKRLHPAVVRYIQTITRSGGKVGGLARARALSPARRSEIARKAAFARWHSLQDIVGASDHKRRNTEEKKGRQRLRRAR